MRDGARAGGPAAALADVGVTRRESEVLAAVSERLTNAEIADRLSVSERTIESHVASLLRKLGVSNRIELATVARTRDDRARPPIPPLPSYIESLADRESFIGRDAALERLRQQWARPSDGHALVSLIAGEAGIGKSRLAAELTAEIHAGGGRVLVGGCFEDVPVPYAPFMQARGDEAVGLDTDEIARRVGAGAAWARLVPDLATRVAMPVTREVFDAATAQAEVFQALNGYLSRVADHGPTLLLVEDVHWATAATRGALRHIARTARRDRLLVVLTTRDTPPDLDDTLSLFLADLARIPTVERIDLIGLAEHEVAALLGNHRDADVAAITEDTGGNPLLVREVAHGLGSAGSSLESLLARRYLRLDSEALHTLEVASVLGTEFDVDVLAAAAARSRSDVHDCLEQARSAGLVVSTGRANRFAFVHGLFRRARYDAIPAGRRMRNHAKVVEALAPRAADVTVIAELARHAQLAAPISDARRALGFATDAARVAERSMALTEAASCYRAALDCAAYLEPPDPDLELGLMIRLGEVLHGAGVSDYRAVLSEAADRARSRQDAEALAEVGSALVKYSAGRDPGSPDYLLLAEITRDALSGLGDAPSPARARTLAAAAEDRCYTDPAGANALVEEALDIARRLDDPRTLGHVLAAYRLAGRTPGNALARHPAADELIAIGQRTGQPTFTMLGFVARAWSFREQGDLRAADIALEAALDASGGALLPPAFQAAVAAMRVGQALLRGDIRGAEQVAEGMWALAAEGFDPTNWIGPALLAIRHHQGRLPELVPMLEFAGEQAGIGAPYEATRAVALALAGRTDEATTAVQVLTEHDLAKVPRNFTYLTCLVALAEAAAIVGDATAARTLMPRLEEHSGLIAEVPQTPVAPVDLAIADVALAAGDLEKATHYAEQAVEASRVRGTPVYLGRELVRLAAARGRAGIRADATAPLVNEALAIAATTGAAVIEADAKRYVLIG
jgi:DNA-binding CsgD family transcriptional regulator/tetratricopeptide (TPR) repeat protein